MDEITAVSTDSAQETEQASTSEKESTSKAPVTYTEATQQKAVSDALAEQGRKHKEALDPITQERDTFKSQAEQAVKDAKDATTALEETRGHISDLESDIEAFDEDTEDPNKLTKLRKELRDARGKVRDEFRDKENALEELRKTAEAEREEWSGTVAEAQTFKFDKELVKLVEDYEGDAAANFTKLTDSGVKTIEDARSTAETFLAKKVEEPELLDESGVTSGTKDRIGDLPPEQWEKALEAKMNK